MSIPASTIVSVVPSVLAAGGNPLALNGLFLSANPNLPLGAPLSFPTLASVQAYFGQYSVNFTGTCVTNTLTVTACPLNSSGNPVSVLAVGMELQSTLAVGMPPGTYITALGTYSTITGLGTVTISGPGFTQASPSAFTANCLESQMASVYFNGFTASTLKPTALLMSRMPIVAINAFMRSGNVAAITPAQISAIAGAGAVSVTIDGVLKTTSTLNLTTAVVGSVINWATVATLLGTALTIGTQVTFNTQLNALQIVSTTTGGTSTITAGTGAAAVTLNLAASSPVPCTLSQGSAAVTPGTFMAALALYTTNWAAFTTCFEPTGGAGGDKLLYSTWASGTGGQFVYAPYDSDATIVSSNSSTTCISHLAAAASLAGTCAWYLDPNAAAFCLGVVASTNYNATAGRAAIAFKSGTGISASISDPTSYAYAIANGTNFYGNWATANSQFNMAYNGAITGPFGWLDSYVGAIWLNSALQLALVNLFTIMNSIPYNNAGYTTIKTGCKGTLDLALNNGVISRGVVLTPSQANAVDTAAGLVIDPILATIGYYLQVLPANSTQRNARQSPTCTLWYMDGGSVNQLNLASINIQ
jgi:hypothetical protein